MTPADIANARWLPFLEAFFAHVPGAGQLLDADEQDEAFGRKPWYHGRYEIWTPGFLHASLSTTILRDDRPATGLEWFWPGYLAFVEVVGAAMDLLAELRPVPEDDIMDLDCFAGTGFFCEATRDRAGLLELSHIWVR